MVPALLLSALMAASAAVATPGAGHGAASGGPITKDGVEITVLPQIGVAGAPASVTEVGLDIEAKTTDAATRLGFHSLRAVADVDCGKGANRFISAEAFDQVGLAGPGRLRNVTGQWVQPTSDSYMAAVIGRVCEAPVAAASRPPPLVKELASASPPPASARAPAPASQALAPAAAPPPPQAAPAAPAPTPPLVVKFNRGVPAATPPAAAPKPAAAPPATPAAAPPPSGPLVVKFNGAPPGAAPPSAAAPLRPPATGWRRWPPAPTSTTPRRCCASCGR